MILKKLEGLLGNKNVNEQEENTDEIMRKVSIGDSIKIMYVYNTYGGIYVDICMYTIVLSMFVLIKKTGFKAY